MTMKLLLLILCASHTIAEIYVFTVKSTAVTGISHVPDVTAVSYLHGKQIYYYDSRSHVLVPRQTWARSELGDLYWQITELQHFLDSFHLQKTLRSAMKSFKHTEGVHTLQRMWGCLWDKDSGYSEGFDVYGYDGENFLSLDLERGSFTALVPQAESTAEDLNQNMTQLKLLHLYYTLECQVWLKIMFGYHSTSYHQLKGIFIPTLTQHLKRSYPAAVLCHASGLSTSAVQMSWQKHGEDVFHHVRIGETLPSGDGSFQKTIYLYVGHKELQNLLDKQYKCVIKFMTLTGKVLATISVDTSLVMSYDRSHSHAHHSKWWSDDDDGDDEEDYDMEDYDEEAYVEDDYDEEAYVEDDYDENNLYADWPVL